MRMFILVLFTIIVIVLFTIFVKRSPKFSHKKLSQHLLHILIYKYTNNTHIPLIIFFFVV